MTTDATNTFYTDPTAEVVSASTLDAGSGSASAFDWLGNGLSKMLDTYAAIDIAHLQARQAAPTGYYRVPGTNQVQPVGSPAGGIAGISTSMILIGVAALALIFFVVKKA